MSEIAGLFDDHNDFGNNDAFFPEEQPEPTSNLPINLDSLRDGPPGSKPFYPYSTLLRYAIKGSPNQKLLLEDIYYAIESRFPYFKTAPSGWKNSIRHNLTLNPCFEKIARPLTDRGKGSYWIVNDSIDPRTGVHRVRKKKEKAKSGSNSEERDLDYVQPTYVDPHAQHYDQGMQQPLPNEHGHYPPSAYPPPFNPNFHMMPDGSDFQPPPNMIQHQQSTPSIAPTALMAPLDVGYYLTDEHGNPDWRTTWSDELGHLREVTSQQDKAQTNQEWYRVMLLYVREGVPPFMAAHMPQGPIMQIPDGSMGAHL